LLTRPERFSAEGVQLAIFEAGAGKLDLPSSFDCSHTAGAETIVVTQAEGELSVSLMYRVGSEIGALERAGKRIRRAVLVVGATSGNQWSAARVLITRALFTSMHAHGGGELSIVTIGAEETVRHELLALVEGLVAEHAPCSVTIRLRFERDEAPRGNASGTFRVAERDDSDQHATKSRRG
jgi:hypothetical protein